MTIETEEQLLEILEDPSIIVIETSSDKHDAIWYHCVIKIGEKHYEFSYTSSYNNGIQFWGEIDLVEVKPVEYIAIKWEKV